MKASSVLNSHYHFVHQLQSIRAGNLDESIAQLRNHQSCEDGTCGFKQGTNFVQCDSCGLWQHTACAGVSSYEEFHPAKYVCGRCSNNIVSMMGMRWIQASAADELPLNRRSICWGISNFILHHHSRPDLSWALRNFTVLELSLIFEDYLFSQNWKVYSHLPPNSYTKAVYGFSQTLGQMLQDLENQIGSEQQLSSSTAESLSSRCRSQTLAQSSLDRISGSLNNGADVRIDSDSEYNITTHSSDSEHSPTIDVRPTNKRRRTSTPLSQHSTAESPNKRRRLRTPEASNLSHDAPRANEEHSETETLASGEHNKMGLTQRTNARPMTELEKTPPRKSVIVRRGDKDYCNLCQKELSKSNSKVHYDRMHLRPLGHECAECHETFSRRDYLARHLRCNCAIEWRGEEDYCNICEKILAKRTGYGHYERMHLQRKRYECTTCHRTFDRQDRLDIHSSCNCDIEQRGDKDYCKLCAKEMFNGYSHYRSKHLGLKKHKCPQCQKGFDSQKDLRRHSKRKCKEVRWTLEEIGLLEEAIAAKGTGESYQLPSRSAGAVALKMSQLTSVKVCVSCRRSYLVGDKHECLKGCQNCAESCSTYKKLRKHRRRRHPEELKKRNMLSNKSIEKMQKLRKDGWSYTKIGKKMGKSCSSIHDALKRRKSWKRYLKPEECQQLIDLVEVEPRESWKDVKVRMDENLDRPRSLKTLQVIYGRIRSDPRFI